MKIDNWEKVLDHSPYLRDAISLLHKIENMGYEAYIVGGAPRDIILNKVSYDIDITTNCPIKELENEFDTKEIGKSKDFGITMVIFKESTFEVAEFRSDGKYIDGRRPETVKSAKNLEEDIKRRDFTINTIALDRSGNVIDIMGGIKDLENKLIKSVGNPLARFNEDYVRIIRALRFGAADGFTIDEGTSKAITLMADKTSKISPDRIRLELVKSADKPGKIFARFITLLEDFGVLKYILPELSYLKECPHTKDFHPEGATVWDHVIRSVEISNNDWISQLAILFHDVGKGQTLVFREPDNKPTYHFHAKVGGEIVSNICDRLKFSEHHKKVLMYTTENHMKWHGLLEMRPSKISRIVSSPYFNILVNVCKADEFSRGEKFASKEDFERKLDYAIEIKKKWGSNQNFERDNTQVKIVDGKKIMELTGLPQSKPVGEIKKEVEDYIIDNDIDPSNEKILKDIIMGAFKKYKGGI